MEELDEKGFVFLSDGRPYLCAMYGGEPWIMYWHDHDKSWVTKQRANQTMIWGAYELKISDEDAEHYHKLHKERTEKRLSLVSK